MSSSTGSSTGSTTASGNTTPPPPPAWSRPRRRRCRAARRRWCRGRRSASTAAPSWPAPPPRPSCGPSMAPGPRSWSRSGSTPGCGRPARPTSGQRSPSGSWSGPVPSGGGPGGGHHDRHRLGRPNAASSLEYLHRGNTALVGLQYSYLPSWVSFLVDRDEAAEAGVALYRHVHRRWAQLPAGDRPRLVIFRESLGSFGAEAAFRGSDGTASLANLVAGSDGALFTGPTASNRIWDQFTDGREPGTPVWRPVHDGGTKVQFANRPADLERADEAWRHPRVLYVHHPSDPVGNATVEAFWRRPEWTDRPQGYDVPARAGWYPIVTGLQEVADLIAGFGATSGYGHNYGIDFVTGWAAVVPPEGWTAADSVRLQRQLPTE